MDFAPILQDPSLILTMSRVEQVRAVGYLHKEGVIDQAKRSEFFALSHEVCGKELEKLFRELAAKKASGPALAPPGPIAAAPPPPEVAPPPPTAGAAPPPPPPPGAAPETAAAPPPPTTKGRGRRSAPAEGGEGAPPQPAAPASMELPVEFLRQFADLKASVALATTGIQNAASKDAVAQGFGATGLEIQKAREEIRALSAQMQTLQGLVGVIGSLILGMEVDELLAMIPQEAPPPPPSPGK